MAEKRFKIDLDEEAITDNGEYCLSLYCFQDKGERDVCDLLNALNDENESLKQQLKEFEDFVYSDEGILCYTCVHCTSKGIYEVECSEKGKVDVHSSCFAYWKDEVEKND